MILKSICFLFMEQDNSRNTLVGQANGPSILVLILWQWQQGTQFRESTWASASCGPFYLYSLGIHHFWICDVRGDIPTCNLQYLFMDLLSMNLSLSLNYVEVNPFGIVVQ